MQSCLDFKSDQTDLLPRCRLWFTYCRARYDSGCSCPLYPQCLLSFRSNGNYIPPPQEVRASSASLLAQIRWLVWERAESGRVSVRRRTSNTRSRSCSEKLAFFQKIHAMRCQHWIQIFLLLLSPLVLVSSTKLLSSSTFFKWYSAPPWWSNHELFLLFSIF